MYQYDGESCRLTIHAVVLTYCATTNCPAKENYGYIKCGFVNFNDTVVLTSGNNELLVFFSQELHNLTCTALWEGANGLCGSSTTTYTHGPLLLERGFVDSCLFCHLSWGAQLSAWMTFLDFSGFISCFQSKRTPPCRERVLWENDFCTVPKMMVGRACGNGVLFCINYEVLTEW